MMTFETRDPSVPAFWSERFDKSFMPWDHGGVPARFRRFVTQSPRPYVTLIPGCGTAYELVFLSEAGWNATAIDFSPAAVEAARRHAGPWAQRIVEADFFHFVPPAPVELIYERAFLCALPPRMRADVVARWARLLPAGGLLAGFFFFGDQPKGPPFGIAQEELRTLLQPFFECTEDEATEDSLPVFAGRERWQVWRRLA